MVKMADCRYCDGELDYMCMEYLGTDISDDLKTVLVSFKACCEKCGKEHILRFAYKYDDYMEIEKIEECI